MVRGQLLGRRPDLRLHVLGDAAGVSGTVVVLAELSAAEDLEGGVAPHLKPVASVLADLCAVDFGQGDKRVVGQQVLGGPVELGLQFFAVSTPESNSKVSA